MQVLALICSDIVGDPIQLIAGGPTVSQALSDVQPILEALSITADQLPVSVLQRLRDHPPAAAQSSSGVQNVVICNNQLAVSAMADLLQHDHRYAVQVLSTGLEADATALGTALARLLQELILHKSSHQLEQFGCRPIQLGDSGRHLLLLAGETTVEVRGKGLGGRNQHLGAVALLQLGRLHCWQSRVGYALLSAGTDGQDGPTDAAGALIDESDVAWLQQHPDQLHMLEQCILENDSYRFWRSFRDGRCHLLTGPTGTNVMDIISISIEYDR